MLDRTRSWRALCAQGFILQRTVTRDLLHYDISSSIVLENDISEGSDYLHVSDYQKVY